MKEKMIETIRMHELVRFKKFKNYLKMSNYDESILIHVMYYSPYFSLFNFMKQNKAYSADEIIDNLNKNR